MRLQKDVPTFGIRRHMVPTVSQVPVADGAIVKVNPSTQLLHARDEILAISVILAYGVCGRS
ncbi:MAG: hypothetical protein ABIR70_02075 [Bryobacteraceae bacterium]